MRTDLSWSDHYYYILSKVYKTMGLLRRTLVQKSIYERTILYLSLVRSVLTYCSQIWRPQYLKYIRVLENVQRRATKFILNDYKSCYKSRLLTLQGRRQLLQIGGAHDKARQRAIAIKRGLGHASPRIFWGFSGYLRSILMQCQVF